MNIYVKNFDQGSFLSKIMYGIKYRLRLDNVVNEHNIKQIFSLTAGNQGNLSQKIFLRELFLDESCIPCSEFNY